jgi:hypothetical protein
LATAALEARLQVVVNQMTGCRDCFSQRSDELATRHYRATDQRLTTSFDTITKQVRLDRNDYH